MQTEITFAVTAMIASKAIKVTGPSEPVDGVQDL
jgi:hypothetical protein